MYNMYISYQVGFISTTCLVLMDECEANAKQVLTESFRYGDGLQQANQGNHSNTSSQALQSTGGTTPESRQIVYISVHYIITCSHVAIILNPSRRVV